MSNCLKRIIHDNNSTLRMTITLFVAIKKEKADREKDSAMIKERIDNERKEIQISVDKVTRKWGFKPKYEENNIDEFISP